MIYYIDDFFNGQILQISSVLENRQRFGVRFVIVLKFSGQELLLSRNSVVKWRAGPEKGPSVYSKSDLQVNAPKIGKENR